MEDEYTELPASREKSNNATDQKSKLHEADRCCKKEDRMLVTNAAKPKSKSCKQTDAASKKEVASTKGQRWPPFTHQPMMRRARASFLPEGGRRGNRHDKCP